MNKSVSQAVGRVFEKTSDFVLIGLTGRTGSGCSTAAKIMKSSDIPLPEKSDIYDTEDDQRKYRIVRRYIKENWAPFKVIRVRDVITAFLLEMDFDEFVGYVSEKILEKEIEDVRKPCEGIKAEYNSVHEKIKESLENGNVAELHSLYFDNPPKFTDTLEGKLRNINPDAYTKIYQALGDNIRASGKANDSNFDSDKIFDFPEAINNIVKLIRAKNKKKGTHIVIDAIRNPYEALFFKQRYNNFFLISINTEDAERLDRLRKNNDFSDQEIKELDDKEYPEKLSGKEEFTSQNIKRCIELSDIHIHNSRGTKHSQVELCTHLAWYLSLIRHPGLITPTAIERNMQLAYTAKLNSGCISRQVGAVVTDEHYSVKATGWNSTPEGQVPCLLRSVEELCAGGGKEEVYSHYERTDEEFRNVLKNTYEEHMDSLNKTKVLEYKDRIVYKRSPLCGRNLSYCFKELRQEVEGEKNQVHTRSVHAEENAFLQIAKYGGQPLRGGILFTTASPCELCAKKAYQLGISKIYYIDPYPGIAERHVLRSGTNQPKLILFWGAVGCAYHKLYQPFMGYKDELKMLIGYAVSGGNKKNKKEIRIRRLKKKIRSLNKRIEDC